jgi:hypothetical protein
MDTHSMRVERQRDVGKDQKESRPPAAEAVNVIVKSVIKAVVGSAACCRRSMLSIALIGSALMAQRLCELNEARPPRTSLAVCAAVRDSPENVLEWVEYHHDRSNGVGVDKFYLMVTDDPDVEVLQRALETYIAGGLVELYSLPYVNPRTVPQLQVRLYRACLDSVRDLHDFVGFWDVDEFVVRGAHGGSGSRENLK